MPIVDGQTYKTLVAAVKSPKAYVTGAERKKLNAAFDIATSKIFVHVFKYEAGNPMIMRRKLNSTEEKDLPPEYCGLIEALKDALKSAAPLRSKAYPDDSEDDDMVSFVDSKLKELLRQLDAIK